MTSTVSIMDATAHAWLQPGTSAVVHSVFTHAVNLELPGGRFLTLADPSLGSGPRAISLAGPDRRPFTAGDDLWLTPAAIETPSGDVALPDVVRDHALVLAPVRPAALAHARALCTAAAVPPVGTWEAHSDRLLAARFAALLDGVATPDADLTSPVAALVGLGQGLTPSGDDLLCGLTLALPQSGTWAPRRSALVAAVATAAHTTVPLSASFLADAGRGQARSQIHQLVSALATGIDVPSAVEGVLTIGHRSGHDLLTGLLSGLSCAHSPLLSKGLA